MESWWRRVCLQNSSRYPEWEWEKKWMAIPVMNSDFEQKIWLQAKNIYIQYINIYEWNSHSFILLPVLHLEPLWTDHIRIYVHIYTHKICLLFKNWSNNLKHYMWFRELGSHQIHVLTHITTKVPIALHHHPLCLDSTFGSLGFIGLFVYSTYKGNHLIFIFHLLTYFA